ncbi:hypothetical protein [Archangium sp. Cb G35]|uniref:hypothetical protein n=1 Tax=Archangium sp. Cb G35 TaxID=1920190 RepID=UPI000ABD6664|nr:hypothetical protein [Archangium sp. Cb G35]
MLKVPSGGLAGEAKEGTGWKSTRKRSIEEWERKLGIKIPDNDKVNHMTPTDAGGCPSSMQNLVPTAVLQGDCLEIENAQTRIQNMLPADKAERAKVLW